VFKAHICTGGNPVFIHAKSEDRRNKAEMKYTMKPSRYPRKSTYPQHLALPSNINAEKRRNHAPNVTLQKLRPSDKHHQDRHLHQFCLMFSSTLKLIKAILLALKKLQNEKRLELIDVKLKTTQCLRNGVWNAP